MKVYGLWYGGNCYAVPSIYNRDDIEVFESIQLAKDTLVERRENWGHPKTPCVSSESEIQLFYNDPYGVQESPDRIISFGPRGGVIEV